MSYSTCLSLYRSTLLPTTISETFTQTQKRSYGLYNDNNNKNNNNNNSGFLYSAHIRYSMMLKALQHFLFSFKVCWATFELWNLLRNTLVSYSALPMVARLALLQLIRIMYLSLILLLGDLVHFFLEKLNLAKRLWTRDAVH